MKRETISSRSRLDELLAGRATTGISVAEDSELGALLEVFPEADGDEFDRIAAAVDLTFSGFDDAPLPASVRRRVDRSAVRWLAESKGLDVVDRVEGADQGVRAAAPRQTEPAPGGSRIGVSVAWLLAAACVVLAVLAWLPESPAPDLAERFRAIAARPDAVMHTMTDADGNAVGEIGWDSRTQQGVMRLRGLDANDPSAFQYQLWIVDRARSAHSEFTAVDGGVFDVPAGAGEVFIPVDAKLRVFEPELFAVTTEPPGGVVKHVETEAHRTILTSRVSG